MSDHDKWTSYSLGNVPNWNEIFEITLCVDQINDPRRTLTAIELSLTMIVERGPPTVRVIMRKLITTIVWLALVDSSVSIAQPAGSRNPTAAPSMNSDQQSLPEAPVGHRQPRADQVPSEKTLMNPNDPVNQENAALDRMINGICRGC
jgi:hypothetical protein